VYRTAVLLIAHGLSRQKLRITARHEQFPIMCAHVIAFYVDMIRMLLFRRLQGSYGRFNHRLSSYKSPSRRIASLPFDWQRNSRGYQRFFPRSRASPDSFVPLFSNAVLLLVISLRLGPPARRRRDIVSHKTLNFPLVIGTASTIRKPLGLASRT